MILRCNRIIAALIGASCFCAAHAEYPTRPVKMVELIALV
jgi:hypothetical protein